MPENYTFVSRDKDNWTSILITKGNYEGVIYRYGRVSVSEKENNEGNLPLSFKFNVLDYNNHNEEELNASVEFKDTIGDILVEILDEQLEADNLEYNDWTNSTNTTCNEWAVCKKGFAFYKERLFCW